MSNTAADHRSLLVCRHTEARCRLYRRWAEEVDAGLWDWIEMQIVLKNQPVDPSTERVFTRRSDGLMKRLRRSYVMECQAFGAFAAAVLRWLDRQPAAAVENG